MALASINFSASVVDGTETKTITSNGSVSCQSLTSGSQIIGNTYEPFATNATPGDCTVIIYNTGTVDASIRLSTAAATDDYQFLNCIAGGMIVVHPIVGDLYSKWSSIQARSDSGTVTLDYCIIR